MKLLLLPILIFTFCIQKTFSQSSDGSYMRPLVKISSGALLGVKENNISIFKGIPYAAPPVGDFRWRPPQPIKSWDSVRDASKFCADCVQRSFPNSQTVTSEDCLFLN